MATFRLLSLIEVVEEGPRADEVDLRECVGRPVRDFIMFLFFSLSFKWFINVFFLIKIMENHQTNVFSNLFAPWQEISADAGDGDGGGGPFGIILRSF